MVIKTSFGQLFFDPATGVAVLTFEPPRQCRCGALVAFAEHRPDGTGGCSSCAPKATP
jgi:hypothetical protein